MSDANEVEAAFDILLEEVENAIEVLNQDGAAAFGKANYERTQELADRGKQMTALRGKVTDLRREWSTLFASVATRRRKRKTTGKRPGRLERGFRTPEDAFRVPILKALQDLGDSAPIGTVLNTVGQLMADKLNEHDRLPLQSTPDSVRWRNTAQWTRAKMVKEGLMADDSPRGTWEITHAGRRWLADQEQ